jgi:hypothetical protein
MTGNFAWFYFHTGYDKIVDKHDNL